MSRELLLWQIKWMIYHYSVDRLYQSMHSPLWAMYERALETDDWGEYRIAYEAQA